MSANPVVAVRILHLDRRVGLDWHYPDLCAPYWRFYWNLAGDAAVTIERRRYVLPPHAAWLIPPDTHFSSEGSALDHFYVHFVLPEDTLFTEHGIFAIPDSDELAPAVLSLAGRLAAAGDAGRLAREVGIPDQLTTAAAGLVLLALSRLPAQAPLDRVADPIVRQAMRVVSGRLDTRLTSAHVAEACGCDERTLRRRFHAALGMTPVQFALRRRIEHSCMLLHFSPLSIDEIARESGFCDRHHFTRVFSRERGTTPAAFRRVSDQLGAG